MNTDNCRIVVSPRLLQLCGSAIGKSGVMRKSRVLQHQAKFLYQTRFQGSQNSFPFKISSLAIFNRKLVQGIIRTLCCARLRVEFPVWLSRSLIRIVYIDQSLCKFEF